MNWLYQARLCYTIIFNILHLLANLLYFIDDQIHCIILSDKGHKATILALRHDTKDQK